MAAIKMSGLTKAYGDVTAVDTLDLSIDQGEVFGFLGSNGAGKSTTINMLTGFLYPTSGEATVFDNDVVQKSQSIRKQTGLLPEGFTPYKNLSGRAHIKSSIQTKRSDESPDDILERVGLSSRDASRPAGSYSTGMTQRLGLGIALAGDPDLLILDEPSSGLDPNGIKRLREIVRIESERGTTVFFSSHILDHVEKICDRIGIMRNGELVANDRIEDLNNKTSAGVTIKATVESVPSKDNILNLHGVENVAIEDNTIHAICSSQSDKMMFLEELNSLTEVRDFSTGDTSLESVFESLAGEEQSIPEQPTQLAQSSDEKGGHK